MSNLQKSFAKARVERHLPLATAFDETEEEKDQEDDTVPERTRDGDGDGDADGDHDAPDDASDASDSSTATIRPSPSLTTKSQSLFRNRKSRYVQIGVPLLRTYNAYISGGPRS